MIPSAPDDNVVRLREPGAALAFLGVIAVLVLMSRQIAPPIIPYVAALIGGSLAVSLLAWRPLTLSARTVFGVALIGHALALFGHSAFEDDYYRFLWDGWRLLETGTPYGVSPALFIDDPAIPVAWQAVREWINYPELPTMRPRAMRAPITARGAGLRPCYPPARPISSLMKACSAPAIRRP